MSKVPHLSVFKSTAIPSPSLSIDSTLVKQIDRKLTKYAMNNKNVVLGVGSRFIKDQLAILNALITVLRTKGARISIIPAMGSHGGASDEGQLAILAAEGITEETLGVPLISHVIPRSIPIKDSLLIKNGLSEIYIDEFAAQADIVILINRIKPHTSFSGPVQSGLSKMACIGLGKAKGAAVYHHLFEAMGFSNVLPRIVAEVSRHIPLLIGVALIENSISQISYFDIIESQDWHSVEPILLKSAIEQMPHIPLETADILIVDELGKAVSGSGMDTNIIGIKQDIFNFKVKYIYARRMAEGSGGNAVGMGLADIIHRQLLNEVDFSVSYINAETSLSPSSVKIPITYNSDRDAWEALFRLGGGNPDKIPIVVWIRNTSNLQYILTNHNKNIKGYELIKESLPIHFDDNGNLPEFNELTTL